MPDRDEENAKKAQQEANIKLFQETSRPQEQPRPAQAVQVQHKGIIHVGQAQQLGYRDENE